MTLADLPQVRALTTREKLQLVDELWTDLVKDAGSLEVSNEEKALLDERWQRFVANPASGLTLPEFRKRVDALRA